MSKLNSAIFTEIILVVFGDFILDKMSMLFHVSAPFITIGRVIRIIVPAGVVFITLALMYFVIPSHRLSLIVCFPEPCSLQFFGWEVHGCFLFMLLDSVDILSIMEAWVASLYS